MNSKTIRLELVMELIFNSHYKRFRDNWGKKLRYPEDARGKLYTQWSTNTVWY